MLIFCLLTPLTKFKPDLSYIRKTLQGIKRYLFKGQIIILESSTYPDQQRAFDTIFEKFFIEKIFSGIFA